MNFTHWGNFFKPARNYFSEKLYETVWHGRHPTHMVMVKLLLFTGVRNAELAHVQLKDVDLNPCQLRIEQGKGKKDRYVLFPKGFRGELTQYLESQKKKGATYLFESTTTNFKLVVW